MVTPLDLSKVLPGTEVPMELVNESVLAFLSGDQLTVLILQFCPTSFRRGVCCYPALNLDLLSSNDIILILHPVHKDGPRYQPSPKNRDDDQHQYTGSSGLYDDGL